MRVFGQHVPGNPWRSVHDRNHSLFYSPDLSRGVLTFKGEGHKVRDDIRISSSASDDAGVVEGEVHFMMVPWSNTEASETVKFKIMGVNTC